jgi:hyperosmotically inducible protein
MKRTLCVLLLSFSALTFAQQQQQTQPPTSPPETTPPTFPRDQVPPEQMPPDRKATPDDQAHSAELTTPEVQQQIQDGFNSEPTLADKKISVKTDDSSVVVSGTVESEAQHDLALRIVESYAGNRKVVDRITVTSQT